MKTGGGGQGTFLCLLLMAVGLVWVDLALGQEPIGREIGGSQATIRLRKTANVREYKGRLITGEERRIVPGDTLWGILVKEHGIARHQFRRFLELVRALNPRIKNVNVLRVGDRIFIPTAAPELPRVEPQSHSSELAVYRVRRDDTLFKILKYQLGLRGMKEVSQAFDEVKRLNPGKKNWNLIYAGEAIRLPALKKAAPAAAMKTEPSADALSPKTAPVELNDWLALPLSENLDLLQDMTEVVGSQVVRDGEETLALRGGTFHIDRSLFPVIQTPRPGAKVILNFEDSITAPLRAELQTRNPRVSFVTVKKDSPLHEAAQTLFSKMGYDILPEVRPIVVRDHGISLHVKGEWIVASRDNEKDAQALWIISLVHRSHKTSEYLKEYLARKGVYLKEVVIPRSFESGAEAAMPPAHGKSHGPREIEIWPLDKRQLVDAVLRACRVSFSGSQRVSVPLHRGMRINTTVDRLFHVSGNQFGVFFQPVGSDMKKALREKTSILPVELKLDALSSRRLLSVLLTALGQDAEYGKLRFPLFKDNPENKLVLTVSGFFLPKQSLLLTDQTIPEELRRFFFDQGLRVAYFR